MSLLFRLLWRAFALAYIAHVFMLDPDTATFNDLLRILHSPQFLPLAEIIGIVLVSLELAVASLGLAGQSTYGALCVATHHVRTTVQANKDANATA